MALTTEDQLAIQQLYARYNHAIDSGRGDDWAACFTKDGVFSAEGAGTFTGPEQLSGFVNGFAQAMKARHWVNNLVVEAEGAGAKGSCYLQLWNLATKPASLITTAIYDDRLAKTAEGWRFTSRKVNGD